MSYKGSKRQHVWTHNAFIGFATMIRKQAAQIADSPSPNQAAKMLANQIESLATQLEAELRKERIDP